MASEEEELSKSFSLGGLSLSSLSWIASILAGFPSFSKVTSRSCFFRLCNLVHLWIPESLFCLFSSVTKTYSSRFLYFILRLFVIPIGDGQQFLGTSTSLGSWRSNVVKFLELFGEDFTLLSEMSPLCNPLNEMMEKTSLDVGH